MESDFADVARWIIMGMGICLIGFSIAIIQMARRFRAPSTHIYLIALSYILLCVFSIIELHQRLGTNPTWRTLSGFLAFGFGWYAMWEMYKFYKPKARAVRHGQIATERAAELLDGVKEQLVQETILTDEEVTEGKGKL